jgi:YHS domain-containing protein
MLKKITLFILFVLFAVAAPALSAQTDPAKQAPAQTLQSLKHSDVCMVQNRHGIMKMIPVEVDGKMYYGCCAGCVGKLKFSPAVRFSKDPVTGKDVDKASAFIIGNKDGTVTYFESKETAEKFSASKKSL